MQRYDVRALTRKPTPAELADLRQRARAGEYGPPGNPVIAGCFLAFFLVFFVVTVIGVIGGGLATMAALDASGMRGGGSVFRLALVGFGIIFAAILVTAVVRGFTRRNDWAPLALFARDNGLHFVRRSSDPTYPGLIFHVGSSRAAVDHLWSPSGPLADVGSYYFTTGTDKNQTTHRWFYAAFRLPRPTPHVLLDSAENDPTFGSNLPMAFSRDQRVKLGEPFDSRYTLYAPDGYAADAFRLFPPNLMARLMDAPGWIDIELIDSWMFVYTQEAVDLHDPQTWGLLDYLESTVAALVADSVGTYSDDRATPRPDAAATVAALTGPLSGGPAPASGFPGHPVVAEQGRRLRSSWVPILVVLGAFVVFSVLMMSGFLALVPRF